MERLTWISRKEWVAFFEWSMPSFIHSLREFSSWRHSRYPLGTWDWHSTTASTTHAHATTSGKRCWIKRRRHHIWWHSHLWRKSVGWRACHPGHRGHPWGWHPWRRTFGAMSSIWAHGSKWRGHPRGHRGPGWNMHGHTMGWSWWGTHRRFSTRRNERRGTRHRGHVVRTSRRTWWKLFLVHHPRVWWPYLGIHPLTHHWRHYVIFSPPATFNSRTLPSYNINASFQLPLRGWPCFSWPPIRHNNRVHRWRMDKI